MYDSVQKTLNSNAAKFPYPKTAKFWWRENFMFYCTNFFGTLTVGRGATDDSLFAFIILHYFRSVVGASHFVHQQQTYDYHSSITIIMKISVIHHTYSEGIYTINKPEQISLICRQPFYRETETCDTSNKPLSFISSCNRVWLILKIGIFQH